jgi:hypothetical protein
MRFDKNLSGDNFFKGAFDLKAHLDYKDSNAYVLKGYLLSCPKLTHLACTFLRGCLIFLSNVSMKGKWAGKF